MGIYAQLQERHQQLSRLSPTERTQDQEFLVLHWEVISDLTALEGLVAGKTQPQGFVVYLAHELDIADPSDPPESGVAYVDRWFKENQFSYNEAVREILETKPGLLQAIGRALVADTNHQLCTADDKKRLLTHLFGHELRRVLMNPAVEVDVPLVRWD